MATRSSAARSRPATSTALAVHDLVEMLRAHIDAFLADESPDRWLFTVGDGPMYDNDIDWRWRATRTSAGLPHV